MLSRRHLRIKVFQALYAYEQDPEKGLVTAEKNLRKSIDDIYALYLYELNALRLMRAMAKDRIEINRNKKLATEEDLNPNLRFVENQFLSWLDESAVFADQRQKWGVKFGDAKELLRSVFRAFLEDERYLEYMSAPESNLTADKSIVKYLYGKHITTLDSLQQWYEERSMHWADDIDAAQAMAAKTITSFNEKHHPHTSLQNLLKSDDDMDFALELFRKCATQSQKLEESILAQAEHWEGDRIAPVDLILMKMGLAELIHFNQIPVKVTLNEYIELAKQYSTRKSGQFINGILDKLRIQLTESGEIRKIGRGLL